MSDLWYGISIVFQWVLVAGFSIWVAVGLFRWFDLNNPDRKIIRGVLNMTYVAAFPLSFLAFIYALGNSNISRTVLFVSYVVWIFLWMFIFGKMTDKGKKQGKP